MSGRPSITSMRRRNRAMAIQQIFKSECPESDGLYAYVSAKTDGRMFCNAEPIDRGDFWEVEVAPTSGAFSKSDATFPKDNNLSDKEIDKQIHQFERPEFKSVGPAPDAASWTPGIATGLGLKSMPTEDLLKETERLNRQKE